MLGIRASRDTTVYGWSAEEFGPGDVLWKFPEQVTRSTGLGTPSAPPTGPTNRPHFVAVTAALTTGSLVVELTRSSTLHSGHSASTTAPIARSAWLRNLSVNAPAQSRRVVLMVAGAPKPNVSNKTRRSAAYLVEP